jgi:FkbM family methyltransferase
MKPILKASIENHRGHTVLGFAANTSPLVVDCGAHKGEFAQSVVAAWRAQCHSIEASPVLFETLILPEGAKGYNFAVSGEDGEMIFTISDNPEASHIGAASRSGDVQEITVPARSLAGFLDSLGEEDIDLLKLDIEGAEIAALDSLTGRHLARIGQITAEFHDFCGYVNSEQVDAVIARFKAAGFVIFSFSHYTRGDVLMVNSSHHSLSGCDRLRIGVYARNLLGLKRIFRRGL